MPNAQLIVETAIPTVLVLSTLPELTARITHQLSSYELELYTDLLTPPQELELDYCLIIATPELPLNIPQLNQLATRSKRLVLAYPLTRVGELPDFPKNLILCHYGDVFGPNFTHAPELVKLIRDAHQKKRLEIPEDGVIDYHLLPEQDFSISLAKLLIAPALNQKEYTLASLATISLFSLSSLIQQSLPATHLEQVYEASTWADHSYDTNKLQDFFKQISYTPSSDLSQQLVSYLANYKPTLPTPSTPPLASPVVSTLPHQSAKLSSRPRLTPLENHSVPNKPSRLKSFLSSLSISLPKRKSPPLQFVPIASDPSRSLTSSLHAPKSANKRKKPKLREMLLGKRGIFLGGIFFAIILYLTLLITSLTITLLTLKSLSTLTPSTLPSKAALRTARLPALFLEANVVALSSAPVVSRSQSIQALSALLSSYRLGLDTLSQASDLSQTSSSLLSYVLAQDQELDLASTLSLARLQTSELYESLSLLSASLPKEPPPVIPSRYHSDYLKLLESLAAARQYTLTAKSTLSVAPELLGVGESRKYLILFQNNMELRPTGGFIGSFALLSLENGSLYDFSVYDVYSADGQLKGHVEPPAEIKEYLGEANWYLRDSNWDPDFPTSARRAEWFLGKTLNQTVSGTFAINLYTLASILDATGPLTIPEYNEEITSHNLFERAEYHSEVNFFPGSTQKKEFLSSVADALFAKLNSLDSSQILSFAQALTHSLDQKNTLLSFTNENLSRTFDSLGWTGTLQPQPCPKFSDGECYQDYAMLVDSNFAVNKSNYFLNRSLDLAVEINEDLTLTHTLTATYENTSPSTAWPAGAYKSYSRLYLPAGARFKSLTIDSKPVPRSDIKVTSDHGRVVIGYLLQVPITTSSEVKLVYTLADPLSSTSTIYSLYWQKQSGTAPDPLNITLSYPNRLSPVLISPQADLTSNHLVFSLNNSTDRRVTVKFE